MRSVVWVEDNPSDQVLIRSALEPGIEVSFVADGERALEMVGRVRPSLVVLDINMRGLNGLDVLRRLKATPRLAGIPVVLFSASTRPAEVEVALALGAAGYVQKPLTYPALCSAVAAATAHAQEAQPEHQVLFWDTEPFLLEAVHRFLDRARQAGHGVLVLASPERLARLRGALAGARGVWLDTDAALRAITVAGRPDPRRFLDLFEAAYRDASADGDRPVACFGELVAVLHAAGHLEVADAIEGIGQQAAAQHAGALAILCAYPLEVARGPAGEAVRAQHTGVLPASAGLPGLRRPESAA
ncbi:MAG: response regulator [Halobacteriales archaeon]|nr:response regulator [Halobacteriales archaeon]